MQEVLRIAKAKDESLLAHPQPFWIFPTRRFWRRQDVYRKGMLPSFAVAILFCIPLMTWTQGLLPIESDVLYSLVCGAMFPVANALSLGIVERYLRFRMKQNRLNAARQQAALAESGEDSIGS